MATQPNRREVTLHIPAGPEVPIEEVARRARGKLGLAKSKHCFIEPPQWRSPNDRASRDPAEKLSDYGYDVTVCYYYYLS